MFGNKKRDSKQRYRRNGEEISRVFFLFVLKSSEKYRARRIVLFIYVDIRFTTKTNHTRVTEKYISEIYSGFRFNEFAFGIRRRSFRLLIK